MTTQTAIRYLSATRGNATTVTDRAIVSVLARHGWVNRLSGNRYVVRPRGFRALCRILRRTTR